MPSFGAKARLRHSSIQSLQKWVGSFHFSYVYSSAGIYTDDVEYAVFSDPNPADYNIYGYIAKRAHKTPERYNVL